MTAEECRGGGEADTPFEDNLSDLPEPADGLRPVTGGTLAEVAAWLDKQAEDQEFFGAIGDCLRQRFGADDPLTPVVWAFDYMLLSRSNARNEDHGPFGPVLETTGGQHPPPLDKVPNEAVALWEKLSELVTHPFLRARLNDLMWERRWPDRPDLYAVAAIDAYLVLARSEADGIEHVDALARAAGLTREINDRERGQLVVDAAFSRAKAELDGSEPAPGIVIGLLDVAIRIGGEGVHSRVADLLEQARAVFDDPWIQDSLIGQQLAVLTGEQKQHKRLQRQKVDTWLRRASTESGMRRRHFLMRALEYARTYGFREQAEQIRQEIQDLGFDEGDLQRISTEVEVPSEDIEDAISLIVSAESWSGCLKRLLILGPLSGNLKDNIEFVRRQAQEFVFQQLAPIEVLGPWRETIYIARTEEDKERLNLSNHERLTIDMASHVVAIALDEVRASHGEPEKEELAGFFTTPVIEDEIAERIAASIIHFVRDRFDESVMVIIPRIERTIRQLVRKLRAPIWSEPRSGGFGRQRSLQQLLSQLEGHLDENWRRYLNTLLINPLGLNLRNVHMHGLAIRGTREQAAALIQAAVYLSSLRLSTTEDDDSERATPGHDAP